jgi:hypothetical protein
MTYNDVMALRAAMSDCNWDSIPDAIDIRIGISEDRDANDIPDECESDAGEAHRRDVRRLLGLTVQQDSSTHILHVTYIARMASPRPRLDIVTGDGHTLRRLSLPPSSRDWGEVAWDPGPRLSRILPHRGYYVVLRQGSLAYGKAVVVRIHN